MFSLSDEQTEAARAISEWYRERERQPFCLAGYAGSGKSTIIPYLIEELGLNPARIVTE
jgi:exodeoxyribonuclease-5